jgi:hypothetical protein
MNILVSVVGLAIVLTMLAIAIRAAAIPESVRALAWIRCAVLRGSHAPRRQPLGGQRCSDCGVAGADMAELGFEGGGYVPAVRRLYDRDRREFVRTSAWSQGRSGW